MGRSLAIARSAIRWQLLMALAEIPQVCSAGKSEIHPSTITATPEGKCVAGTGERNPSAWPYGWSTANCKRPFGCRQSRRCRR